MTDAGSLMKDALREIQSLRAALARAKSANREPIAIIGMGCRFPGGANDPESYWQLLQNATDAITEVPASRWDVDALYDADPDAPGRMYTRHGGFLEGIDRFDAQFFGVSPRDAENMDPQQRLLLEVAWQAFEHAGQRPGDVPRTGVYIGSFMDDYLQLNFHAAGRAAIDAYNTLGLLRGLAAGRLAYALDLHGPAMQLDTACSSSLLAAHLACQALRNRDCDLALAGGVNLILVPEVTIGLCRMKAMAADGRCKSFDARADGYVRGEGCGIVVLKRLADALADGDTIHAVIRGSAVNHDGRSNGLTAPNGSAQKTVIREALSDAGLEPEQVQLIEAHGTGTSLGDPIEAMALGEVLCSRREEPLLVGSVKSNFGHLESAAGVAALIKSVLAIRHAAIPASLHFEEPNPHIPWDRLRIAVPTTTRAWPETKQRIAGISSFGMTGTNVHMLVEQAPSPAAKVASSAPCLLALSATSEEALDELRERYIARLESTNAPTAHDACFTAARGRRHFDHRLAVVGDSSAALAGKLRATSPTHEQARKRPRVAFLFPGQGLRIRGVGAELYRQAPLFKQILDECNEILRPILNVPLLELLFATDDAKDIGDDRDALSECDATQASLFAMEYALARLWMSWGIVPDAVLGHSVGEFAAACVAGVFTLEEGLTLIAARERLMNALPERGAMAAIFAAEDRVAAAVRTHGDLSIAALNGAHVVISGATASVLEVAEQFRAQGIDARPLNVAHAFHSRLMEPMLDEFEKLASRIRFRAPNITFISTLTGEKAGEEVAQASYWRRHVRQPVRFAAGIRALREQNSRMLIEVGPQPTLLGMARPILDDGHESFSNVTMLPSLRGDRPELQQLYESLGVVYENGFDIDWKTVFDSGTKVSLPTYPFQRIRYWIERSPSHRRDDGAVETGLRRLPLPFSHDAQFEARLSAAWPPYLRDHGLGGQLVVPAATYVALALESARALHPASQAMLRDVTFAQPLAFASDDSRTLRLIVSSPASAKAQFRFATLQNDAEPFTDASWTTHAAGRIEQVSDALSDFDLAALRDRHPSTPTLVDARSEAGFTIGPSFRWTDQVYRGEDEVLCRMTWPSATAHGVESTLHPGLLDSCLRALALSLPAESIDERELFVPFRIDSLRQAPTAVIPRNLWCHARTTGMTADHITGDIRLLDDSGKLLLEVLGFEARKVAIGTLLGETGTQAHEAREMPLLAIEWQTLADDVPKASVNEIAWLLVAEQAHNASTLVSLLTERGASSRVAILGETSGDELRRMTQELAGDAKRVQVVWLCDATDVGERTLGSLEEMQASLGMTILPMLRMLDDSAIGLCVVTRGAQSVRISDRVDPTHAWLSGLGRVIAMESPRWRWLTIDLEPGSERLHAEADAVIEQCLRTGNDRELAIRDDRSLAPRLVRHEIEETTNKPTVSAAFSYLVTGAFGALGSDVARWLVAQGARHLILSGRRTSSTHPLVTELQSAGIDVLVAGVDVADADSVERLFVAAASSQPPIKGIIHAAGLLDDGLLADQSWDRFARVFAPKVAGSWNLHEQSGALDLHFFVCFSSAAALIGSQGQANYAAANSFMDALMHHRRALGLPALSINWGAWADGGMAARMSEREQQRMHSTGLEPIASATAFEILGRLMSAEIAEAGSAQVGVVPADWARFFDSFVEPPPPLFSNLTTSKTTVTESFLSLLAKAAVDERRELLASQLRASIVATMGKDPFPPGDDTPSFFELGMDSLMSLDLRNRLQTTLERTLPSTVAFEYPTIVELADYLIAEVLPSELFPAATR